MNNNNLLNELKEFNEYSKTNVVRIKNLLSYKMIGLLLNLEYKIENGRIKDKDAEKIKLQYFNTYISGVNTLIRLHSLDDGANPFYDKETINNFMNTIDDNNNSNNDDDAPAENK